MSHTKIEDYALVIPTLDLAYQILNKPRRHIGDSLETEELVKYLRSFLK